MVVVEFTKEDVGMASMGGAQEVIFESNSRAKCIEAANACPGMAVVYKGTSAHGDRQFSRRFNESTVAQLGILFDNGKEARVFYHDSEGRREVKP
jgi:hypothetical protein